MERERDRYKIMKIRFNNKKEKKKRMLLKMMDNRSHHGLCARTSVFYEVNLWVEWMQIEQMAKRRVQMTRVKNTLLELKHMPILSPH